MPSKLCDNCKKQDVCKHCVNMERITNDLETAAREVAELVTVTVECRKCDQINKPQIELPVFMRKGEDNGRA